MKEALAETRLSPATEPLLDAVFGNSAFLGRLALRETGALAEYFAAGPQTVLNAAILLAQAAGRADSEAPGHEGLAHRQAPRRAGHRHGRYRRHLGREPGDGGADPLRRCLCRRRLALSAARTAAQHAAATGWREEACGLTVLAMGKYGAYELNYSSDIDLVVFYDAEKFPFAKRGDPRGAAVDIVRGLVKLMAETTGDGYVFRVDLRLRPDAGATQVAISTDAALDYYEAMGQNWERAAMIKARACAGDPADRRAISCRPSRPSSGGAIWISPPSRTSSPSSARSTPMPAMARSRWRATTSSWAAAASARSNSSPRPSN